MADKIRTLRVELEAGFGSFQKGFAAAGKSTDDLTKKMDRLHDEALRMDRDFARTGDGFSRSSKRAGEFADSVGRVSTTLARSADAFGLPAQALRTLDDVADVAELGLGNLTKGLAGFNAATLGVVGAGAALGAAIGGWANQFKVVRDAADAATASLAKFLFGFDQGKIANATAGMREFTLAMGAKHLEAVQKQIAHQRTLGKTTEDLAKIYKGQLTPAQLEALGIGEKDVELSKKRTAETKKAAEEQKRLDEQFQALVDTLSGQTAQKELDQLTLAFNQLGVQGVADLEALRQKLIQLEKQGAKITDKGLLGVLSGGKVEIPKDLGNLDLGLNLEEMPNLLQISQERFNGIAQAASSAGLSVEGIKQALDSAGASGGALEVALASIPVTFGSVFRDTMAQLPQVILGAIQGGGDVGKSIGSFFGGQFLTGLTGENGPLSKSVLSKILGSTFGGALNAILPGLGSILGAGLGSLFDKIGGLFGGKSDVSKARDAFFGQWSDGFVGLQRELVGTIGEVGQQDFVKQLFDAKSVDEFNRIVAKIKETLAGVGDSVEPVVIPVTVEVTGGAEGSVSLPPLDEALPSFSEGTRGFVNFGDGTLAMLHGLEAVIPKGSEGGIGGDVVNVTIPISENPLQTFEGVRRQRDFTLRTVKGDLVTSLQAVLAAGRA